MGIQYLSSYKQWSLMTTFSQHTLSYMSAKPLDNLGFYGGQLHFSMIARAHL